MTAEHAAVREAARRLGVHEARPRTRRPGMKESNLEAKPERRPTRTYCGVISTFLGPSGWVAKQASSACRP
jgi:hypothetical protein